MGNKGAKNNMKTEIQLNHKYANFTNIYRPSQDSTPRETDTKKLLSGKPKIFWIIVQNLNHPSFVHPSPEWYIKVEFLPHREHTVQNKGEYVNDLYPVGY